MKQTTLETYQVLINERVASFFDEIVGSLSIKDPFILHCYSLIKKYALSPGKRLRPIFLVLSFRASGGGKREEIYLPAIAIELYHTYTLILDDIMDEDELRRNMPTLYKMLQEYFLSRYKEKKYKGSLFTRSSSRFAASIGILLGNLTATLARLALLRTAFRNAQKIKVLTLLEELDQTLCHGQMLDLFFEYRSGISQQAYMTMIQNKTAALFGYSFEMGAILADASPGMAGKLHELGSIIAQGYQIQDDLLDIRGTKGHVLGSDIMKGKKTLLMIKTLEYCNDYQKKFVESVFGTHDADEESIRKVIKLMEKSGAIAYCTNLCNKKLGEAGSILEKLELHPDYKNMLAKLFHVMGRREH